MTIRRRIETMCDDKHISVAELERTVGIANASIRRWDKALPNVAGLIKVADYFRCSVDYLIGRKEEENQSHKPKQVIETYLGSDYDLVHSILELSDYKKGLITKLVGFIK